MRRTLALLLTITALSAQQKPLPTLTDNGGISKERVRAAIDLTPGSTVSIQLPAVTQTTLFNGGFSFALNVPAGASQVTFELRTQSPTTADVDMYVRRSQDIGLNNVGILADYASQTPSGDENIFISNPVATTYYVGFLLFPIATPVNATLRATITFPGCSYQLSTTSLAVPGGGGSGTINLTVADGCVWSAFTSDPWITVTPQSGSGSRAFSYTVGVNTQALRTGSITIAGTLVTIVQSGGGVPPPTSVRFVPVTPCRLADTRAGEGKSGEFGPPILTGNTSRDFNIPAGSCGIPTGASAYSLNITVVPSVPLSFLTVWPAGAARPLASTLNSPGRVVSNAAIVPAGVNGAISVYVTDPTHVIIDINGYFSTSPEALPFFTVDPCRVVDTRATGSTPIPANSTRSFSIAAGTCRIPIDARAISLNATVVPPAPLSFLTLWPAGLTRPLGSTLNSFDGRIVANAAIVPATQPSAGISAYVTDTTNLVLDVNGYFGSFNSTGGLAFFPITPCRAVDTRNANGTFGGPVMPGGSTRDFPIQSTCNLAAGARAYSLNITVVPRRPLSYLTIWPAGLSQPTVSTLNAFDGSIVANAAIVPAGGGPVSVYVTDLADVIIDVNGYFALY